MRVLIDSNVLFSAVYSKGSVPYQAFSKAVEPPNQCLICEQSIEELRRAFNRKFPSKIDSLERFLSFALSVVEVVPVPYLIHPEEEKIRDIDDRPILRAALKAGADILVTGDADFLDSSVTSPRMITAAQFVETVL